MSAPTILLTVAARAARLSARASFRAAVFGVLALVVTFPLLADADLMNLFRDAQVLYPYERNAVTTVLRFGSLPLWDPTYCGGLYALGTPQSRFVSPTFLLSLVFGAARGEALTVFAMIIIGLEGAFRYCRARGGSALGSLLSAPAFALSGTFIASPFLGWTHFFGFELIPWVLVFLRRGMRGDTNASICAGLFFAWIVGFGGTYAAPMTLLLCGYECLELQAGRLSWQQRRRALGMAIFAGFVAAGVAAVRLAPLLETLYSAPRVLAGRPGMTLEQAFSVLVTPVAVKHGNLAWSKQMYTVGAAMLAVAAVGLARRRTWALLPLGALAFMAALGHTTGPWGPFALLTRAPLFSSLRYPERYLIAVALVVAVCAANGVRVLEKRAGRHWVAASALVGAWLLLLGNVGLQVWNFHRVAAARVLQPQPAELTRDFKQARGNRWLAAFYAPMGRGSLSCWEAYPVPMSPLLRGDLENEEYLTDPAAGTVTRRSWSPNAIDLDVALTRPSTVAINQNHHPGWRASVGTVRANAGLLTVALPAGSHRLALRFRPRSALAGGLASLAALLGVAWLARRNPRRETRPREARPGAAASERARLWPLFVVGGLPLALFAVSYGLITEDPPTRAPIQAPSGEPVVAAAPPDGARPVGLTFASGIVLEAFRMPERSTMIPGTPSWIELDWRVTGRPRRSTSIVLSIDADGRTLRRLDHELISAALRFSDAPRGSVLRDIVPFVVPENDNAATWDVWIGLRNVDTDRTLSVANPGARLGRDGLVFLTSFPP